MKTRKSHLLKPFYWNCRDNWRWLEPGVLAKWNSIKAVSMEAILVVLEILVCKLINACCVTRAVLLYFLRSWAGLHKLCYPTIRDRSMWSKFGAHGEHGDVFLFANLGALWFSENLIRYSLHVCLREVKNNLFSFKHSYLRHFSWRF